jgi:3-deoxy-7-phosphoheptulonate synthase
MTSEYPKLQDVNVRENIPLTSPAELKLRYPVTPEVGKFVYESREAVKRILKGEDRRLIAVVGPCSIHNRDIAIEYAHKLAALANEVSERIVIVMRVYFEKPRTTVGWKGLINDPGLNDTFDRFFWK